MRKVLMLSGAALVLASAGANAQQPATTAAQSQPTAAAPKAAQLPGPLTVFNLGYRSTWADGDEARLERYRDLRDGPVAGGAFSMENDASAFQLNAANVGYYDQQYGARYNKYGKLKFNAEWNSIPLNYAYNTYSAWKSEGGNVWKLDPATRTAVQNKTPGVLGIGTSAAHYNLPTVYRGIAMANPFELRSRRDVVNLGLQYRLTEAVAANVGFKTAKRGGNQPFGAAFAFNNGNELPVELDDRTTDLTAGVEWAKAGKSMVRLEWLGSLYKNQFQTLTWDNPLRATDFANTNAPPNGPYDPSGYSNGNGPAVGRLALAPSNSMNTFSLTGLQKLAGRSTLNGNFSYTMMRQDEELIPWTTNSVINSPVVLAAFPHFAHLPRETAEAEINVLNAVLNFTTRPSSKLALDARLRYNDRKNNTPEFDATEWVRFDAVPEESEYGLSAAHDVTRTTLEAGATYSVLRNSSIKLSYVMDDAKRTHRVFGGLRDNTVRLAFDTYGNQLFSVRASVEMTDRNGRDFSEEALVEGGAQLALRFYDEAPLARKAGTLNFQLNPSEKFDLGLAVSASKDEFDDEEQEFGLLDNSNTSYNFTFNWYPSAQVTVGGNVGYDEFSALQTSRNANPLGGTAYESWTDPNRNWSIDNDETVKSLGLFLDLPKVGPNTDLRFNYDYSASDNAFDFFGPRITALATNVAPTPGDAKPCGATSTAPCFKPFEPVTNTWHQLQADLTHMFGNRYGVSAGYSYDKFEIEDFATTNLADGTPRVDPLGGLMTGYGNRPYEGHTLTLRFIYMFQSNRPAM